MTTIVILDGDVEPLNNDGDLSKTIRCHDDWDVRFARGSADVLEQFDGPTHVDAVVASMPAPDGLELLTAVRERSPKTVRVIVSEPSDCLDVWRSVGAAHHYLKAPLDVAEFERAVNVVRPCSATELSDPVRSLVGQADRLPSPPAMFVHIVEMLESDRWTIDRLAGLLSSDVALTTEILKLVNSSFIGLSSSVTSVSQAVSLLGVDMIRSLVLANKLFRPHKDLESWLDLEQLGTRCRAVASGAHALALRDNAPRELAGRAFLSGMVNEVGLLVMARVPDIGASMAAPLNNRVFLEVEQALFGGDRFAVGAHLLQLWGFHDDIVDGIVQLRSLAAPDSDGLPWYLHAARQLVLDKGFNPVDLAAPHGAIPSVDSALDDACAPADIHHI